MNRAVVFLAGLLTGRPRLALRAARATLALAVAGAAVLWAFAQTWQGALTIAVVTGLIVWHRASRPAPALPAAPVELTFLYRWVDPSGRLLYVGITNDLARRTGEHADDKAWMRPGVRCYVESFASRQAALDAELAAIRTERPAHNIAHARR